MTTTACAACGGAATVAFHHEASVPTNSCLLLDERGKAESYPRGSIELRLCSHCGFIGNTSFDPRLSEYSARYEETQACSDRFVDFARDLAKRWVERYDLHGKAVLEIGCGKGEFLEMMCEAGAGRGIGIDPGADPERRQSEAAARIEWITDFYGQAYADIEADAVVCRHTLEHIQPVGDFMRTVRRAIGDRTETAVLFELPDVRRVLEEVAFWDVYYEHCSYFSAGSLARLFRTTGFEVLDLSLDYDDQYLLVEARPAPMTPAPGDPLPLEDDLDAINAAARRFQDGYQATLQGWRTRLHRLREEGGRAVIWGAGSKGVAFLTALAADEIDYAVDINPRKHGMFMAGTGQQIVAPELLRTQPPDLVIVMNPVYIDEISRSLEGLGLSPDVVAV